MEFDPRNWGRVAQTVLVLLVALRLPGLATYTTAASMIGYAVGLVLTTTLVVGVIRAVTVRVRRDDPEPTPA